MSDPGYNYDFVVIGGGSAGYNAARTAVDEGLKTCVIEGGKEVGGLCILRGCMPSKALIASANANLTIKNAARFGLQAQPATFNGRDLIERKRAYIKEFADYRAEQLQNNDFDFIRGWASFSGPHELKVRKLDDNEEITLTSKTFLIAVGSAITLVDVPGLASSRFLTSDDILECTNIPQSAVVVGGGAIAVEMAHYLDALGCDVTIVQRSERILKEMDPDMTEVITKSFRERGMKIYTNTQLQEIEDLGDEHGRRVHFLHNGEPTTVQAERLVYALGRTPATDGLGLDSAEVELAGPRVIVKPTQQTTAPHIFAAGDVSSPLQVVHIAIEEAELAARNAARLIQNAQEDDYERMDYYAKLFGVFCQPQAAVVGLTEGQAETEGIDFAVATYPFNDHGKSLVMEEHEGFVKLIVNKEDGRVIGGACVGPEAVELIHEITVAMCFRSTASRLACVPHYHPTLSEIWTYPAEELATYG
jgi:pyruvate/2-oxoglutarate dehydrogenase complex dihydrolipoamide dehydrogenase (E3) component